MVGRARLCVVIVMAASIAGCATQASNEANCLSRGAEAVGRDVMACYAKAEATPEYREVGSLLPPLDGRRQAPIALLTNRQTPTPEQSATLMRFYNLHLRPCYDAGLAGVAQLDMEMAALATQSVSLGATGYARLASRQITWGQYAEFQNQLRSETLIALARQEERINGRLQAQHAQEVQARGDAFAAASNTMYQWQMVTAANQPRTTNCSVVGGFVNCSTY